MIPRRWPRRCPCCRSGAWRAPRRSSPSSRSPPRWSASRDRTPPGVPPRRAARAGARESGCRRPRPRLRRGQPRCASQPEPPLVHLFAGLVVEDFPLRAALGGGTRIAAQGLPHFLVDGLLEAALFLEHAKDLRSQLSADLVVGDLPDDHALGGREVADDALGQAEESLPAHAHQSGNPRSRASLVLAMVKRRL